jgi:hypothetical protein
MLDPQMRRVAFDPHKMPKYLVGLGDEVSKWKQFRVVIVGEPGSGKTLIADSLRQAHRGKQHTLGDATLVRFKEQGKQFEVFDFASAGNPALELLFVPSALFVITIDARKGSVNQVEDWIKLINARTKAKPTILLIATFMDALRDSDAFLKKVDSGLSRVSSQICELVLFQKNIEVVSISILKFFSEKSVQVPKPFVTLAKSLQQVFESTVGRKSSKESKASGTPKEKKKFSVLKRFSNQTSTEAMPCLMNWNEFRELASREKMLPRDVNKAAEYLHQAGVIYAFSMGNRAAPCVFAQPALAFHFMKLIEMGNEHIITEDSARSNLPSGMKIELLLHVLRDFAAVLPIRRGSKLLLTAALPESPPLVPQSNLGELIWRKFDLAQMVLDFPGRLIAALHHLDDSLAIFGLWKNGASISSPFETISISVQGHVVDVIAYSKNNLRELYLLALEVIESVLRGFYLTNFMRLLCCPMCIDAVQPTVWDSAAIQNAVLGSGVVLCSNHLHFKLQEISPELMLCDVPQISIDQVQLNEMIGQGGFATVFRGVYNGMQVAVKEVRTEETLMEEQLMEFVREARFSARLGSHRNITKLFGVSLSPRLRMVMELIPNGDLFHNFHITTNETKSQRAELLAEAEHIESATVQFYDTMGGLSEGERGIRSEQLRRQRETLQGRNEEFAARQAQLDLQLPWELRIKVCYDVACGMAHLHSSVPPIFHADLRSPNVFLCSLNANDPVCAKVADFGMSLRVAGYTKKVLETWQWLAPEILADQIYDERADIYSFAISM